MQPATSTLHSHSPDYLKPVGSYPQKVLIGPEGETQCRWSIRGTVLSMGEFGLVYRGIDNSAPPSSRSVVLKLCPPLPNPDEEDQDHGHVYNPALLAFAGLDAMLHCGTDLLVTAAIVRDPWVPGQVRPLLVLRDAGDDVRTVYQRFRQVPTSEYPTKPAMPAPLLRKMALQMLSELEALHSAGLLHRDIKPANFCCENPPRSRHDWRAKLPSLRVRMIDYDFATAVLSDPTCFLGTPDYASTTQLTSQVLGVGDDLEALGYTVLACLFAGRLWDVTSGVGAPRHSGGAWAYSQMEEMGSIRDRELVELAVRGTIPAFLVEWLGYCRSLPKDAPADYSFLASLVEGLPEDPDSEDSRQDDVVPAALAPHPNPRQALKGFISSFWDQHMDSAEPSLGVREEHEVEQELRLGMDVDSLQGLGLSGLEDDVGMISPGPGAFQTAAAPQDPEATQSMPTAGFGPGPAATPAFDRAPPANCNDDERAIISPGKTPKSDIENYLRGRGAPSALRTQTPGTGAAARDRFRMGSGSPTPFFVNNDGTARKPSGAEQKAPSTEPAPLGLDAPPTGLKRTRAQLEEGGAAVKQALDFEFGPVYAPAHSPSVSPSALPPLPPALEARLEEQLARIAAANQTTAEAAFATPLGLLCVPGTQPDSADKGPADQADQDQGMLPTQPMEEEPAAAAPAQDPLTALAQMRDFTPERSPAASPRLGDGGDTMLSSPPAAAPALQLGLVPTQPASDLPMSVGFGLAGLGVASGCDLLGGKGGPATVAPVTDPRAASLRAETEPLGDDMDFLLQQVNNFGAGAAAGGN